MEKSDRMNDEKKIIHVLQHTVNSVHGFPDKKSLNDSVQTLCMFEISETKAVEIIEADL